MKHLERMLLYGSGYSILVLTLYYVVASIAAPTVGETVGVSVGRFFLMVLFGFIIAGAELAYKMLKVHKALRIALHYVILLGAFFAIFSHLIGSENTNNMVARVFAWVIVFTVVYILCVMVVFLIRKGVAKADEKIEKKTDDKDKGSTKSKKESYTPRYK